MGTHHATDVHSVTTLSLLGGELCLDFTNTLDPREGKHVHDFINSYTDLAEWSGYTNIFHEDEVNILLQEAASHPQDANRVLQRALALREDIYRVFYALAHQHTPTSADLDQLRDVYIEGIAHAHIVVTTDGFAWDWHPQNLALDSMLWPVIRSAMDLLTSERASKVKECPGLNDCGWLFLDTSKNGTRHWCSMEGCGSRAKMRRQYARKRGIAR